MTDARTVAGEDGVVHRHRVVVTEEDEHCVAHIVMMTHAEIVVVHATASTQHGFKPLPLTVVDRTIGVPGPVRRVQADSGHAVGNREGVVTAHGIEVILAETMTVRARTIDAVTQMSLDEFEGGEGHATFVRGNLSSQRHSIVGQGDWSVSLSRLEVGLGVVVTGETGDFAITGVHRLQQSPVRRQGALDRIVVVPEYRIPRNLHARGGHGGHNATEIAVYLGKTGTLVYVTAMRFGIVEQRIPESLHTFPAIAGTGIGNDRATGQQREIPVEFHVFVIIGVVTSADESVKGPASSRTALKRIDSAHQRGRSEWPQRLLRAEGRASQRMQELDPHR